MWLKMKTFAKVRGSMEIVPNIEVNIDTVYVRSNIVAVNESDFKGWEYDEIQYGKDEFITKISEEKQELTGVVDDLITVLVDKGVVY